MKIILKINQNWTYLENTLKVWDDLWKCSIIRGDLARETSLLEAKGGPFSRQVIQIQQNMDLTSSHLNPATLANADRFWKLLSNLNPALMVSTQ